MANGTTQQQRSPAAAKTRPPTAQQPSVLDRAIEMTVAQKTQKLGEYLATKESDIEACLPDFMRGQAKRLIQRAVGYFARGDWRLQKCTADSFRKCVLGAAELGFALDGRMMHASPFGTKKKNKDGQDEWVNEAVLMPDYKALIAVAKRAGLIQDVWARIVYPTDNFDFHETNGKQEYIFEPDLSRERDSTDGALCVFAVATHKDGWHRVEIMPFADVLKIRERSKSGGDGKGPWMSDPGQMSCKTVIKRLLKTFSDDPGLIRIMELEDEAFAHPDQDPRAETPAELIALARKAEAALKSFGKGGVIPSFDSPAGYAETLHTEPQTEYQVSHPGEDIAADAAREVAEQTLPPTLDPASDAPIEAEMAIGEAGTTDDVVRVLNEWLAMLPNEAQKAQVREWAKQRHHVLVAAAKPRGERSNRQKSLGE